MLDFIAKLAESYLSFAGTVIAAAIWPVFAIVVIWLFRTHVLGLLPFVERFELWGAKVELKRQLSRLVQEEAVAPDPIGHHPADENAAEPEAGQLNESTDEVRDDRQMTVEDAVELLRSKPSQVPTPFLEYIAKQAPWDPSPQATQSIIEAWEALVRTAYQAAVAANIPLSLSPRRIAKMLVNQSLTGGYLVSLVGELESIRNRVVHSPGSADLSDAARFDLLAGRARDRFLSAAAKATAKRGGEK